MMNFKEACNYSNYLTGLINGLEHLMTSTSNYTKRTDVHFKSKANPEAIDETIETEVERVFKGQIQDIAYLAKKLIGEKLKLSVAIEAAKKILIIDWTEDGKSLSIDTAIEYNKSIRNLATNYLNRLTTVKPAVTKLTGRSFKINLAGDQVPYSYDVEATLEVDFDKSIIKQLYNTLLTDADKISSLLDDAQVKNVVEYDSPFSVYDTLEDIIEAYENKLNIKKQGTDLLDKLKNIK